MQRTSLGGRAFLLVLLLFPFWLIMSERMDKQHVVVGILISVLLALFWRDLAPESLPALKIFWGKAGGFGVYLYLLAREIVKSNIRLAGIILDPNLPIKPQLVVRKPPLASDLARVVLANSITLTPGTLTVNLSDGELVVHALTEDAAKEIEEGWYLETKLLQLEEMN